MTRKPRAIPFAALLAKHGRCHLGWMANPFTVTNNILQFPKDYELVLPFLLPGNFMLSTDTAVGLVWKKIVSSLLCSCSLFLSCSFAFEDIQDYWLLNHGQLSAVKLAKQSDYYVRVLTGAVEKIPRTVVILGEVHVKNNEAHLVGKQMLSEFPLRGLESIVPKSSLTKIALLPLATTMNLVYKVASLVGRSKPSTIRVAQKGIHTVTPDTPSLKELHPGSRHQPESKSKNTRFTNIYLEEGSSELVTLGGTGLLTGGMTSIFFSRNLLSGAKDILNNNYTTLSAAITLGGGYLYLQVLGILPVAVYLFADVQTPTASHPFIFPLVYYLLDYRNQIMAQNIFKAFQVRPSENVMLVIVGKAHVAGVAAGLKSLYGFESVSIPKEVLY